jgi:DNA-binding response OmpR family regulator
LAKKISRGLYFKKERPEGIPVIYFSATSENDLLANEAGGDSYLTKPFDLEELEKKLNYLRLEAEGFDLG